MVERSLFVREVPGSIPGASNKTFLFMRCRCYKSYSKTFVGLCLRNATALSQKAEDSICLFIRGSSFAACRLVKIMMSFTFKANP